MTAERGSTDPGQKAYYRLKPDITFGKTYPWTDMLGGMEGSRHSALLEIPLAKGSIALRMFLAAIFSIGGVVLYRSNQAPILGLLLSVFSTAAIVFGFRLLLDSSPGLVATAMGITFNSKLGYGGNVPWNEISGLTLVRYGHDYQLIVTVRHPQIFIDRGKGLYRKLHSMSYTLFGSPIRVNAGLLDYNRADLIRALDDCRSRYSDSRI